MVAGVPGVTGSSRSCATNRMSTFSLLGSRRSKSTSSAITLITRWEKRKGDVIKWYGMTRGETKWDGMGRKNCVR